MVQKIIPIKSTTQKFIEVVDIQNGIVLFVDGSCAMVLASTAVNFSLLSDKEQDMIIYSYAGLLNSLSFPIQILIRTQHKDISSYLKLLEIQEEKQQKPKLKQSISRYREFVAQTVKEKDVLDKKFYIIIPFSSLELGPSASVLLGNKKTGLPQPKEQIFEKAQVVLSPKKDHIIRLLARVGLKSDALNDEKLLKLFFTIYNQDSLMPEKKTDNN